MKTVLVSLIAIALFAACSSSTESSNNTATTVADPTTTRPPAPMSVRGTWVNPRASITTGTKTIAGKTVLFQRSGTIWRGDLDGSTTFTARLVQDPANPANFAGTIKETFTGTVRGVGSGHLFFDETITFSLTAPGPTDVKATIIRGDGALRGITGHLHFTGTSAASGIGHGPYDGSIKPASP